MSNLKEKTLSTEKVFDGCLLKVMVDEVKLPDGSEAVREYINHQGGVCVAALDKDNNIYFVRQYRYPYHEEVWELPAGKLEKGQTPLENGKRELMEETGCAGYSYISLGQMYPTPGYTDEITHLYACRVDSVGSNNTDSDEFLEVRKIPFDKAVEMVLNNQLPDGKTQLCILKLKALLDSGKI